MAGSWRVEIQVSYRLPKKRCLARLQLLVTTPASGSHLVAASPSKAGIEKPLMSAKDTSGNPGEFGNLALKSGYQYQCFLRKLFQNNSLSYTIEMKDTKRS